MNGTSMRQPDVCERRSGGGCVAFFGLPFLAAGLFVMLGSLRVFPVKGQMPPLIFGLPFGAVFVAIGTAILFGRSGLIINKLDGTIVKWWGLLGPFKRKQYAVGDFDRITLTKEIRRSKNSSYTVYPVRIAGPDVKPIHVEEQRDYASARKSGEALAKFMEVSLADSTTGVEVVRRHDELDASLRERAKREGALPEMPPPPPEMKTICNIEGRAVTLELPAAKITVADLLSLILGPIVPLFVLLVFARPLWSDKGMPMPARVIFIGFVGTLFVLLPLLLTWGRVCSKKRSRTRVIASQEHLRVEKRHMFSTSTITIPADELEELLLPGSGAMDFRREAALQSLPPTARELFSRMAPTAGIHARSDKTTVSFGEGLPTAELQWIHAVILRMMTV